MASSKEKIQIEPVLESVLRYCLDDARKRMESGESIVPFSALAVGETLFMEEYAADEPAAAFAAARTTVAGARGAQAYGFCYDGYITVDTAFEQNVQRDCLIAEGGTPGADYGHAIGLPYKTNSEGRITFTNEPIYVSKALNYMATLSEDGRESDLQVETFTGAKEFSDDTA